MYRHAHQCIHGRTEELNATAWPAGRATETSVRHAPGFISASLHRGLDGTKVTMYAQWRSVEDYQAMRENPAPMHYFQQALAIAKFEPDMYEVVETFSPADAGG
jgi:quinol monooxygenase YgiN